MDLEHKDLNTDMFPYIVATDISNEDEIWQREEKRMAKNDSCHKLLKVTKLFVI